jgi:hypothetical protein
MEGAVERVRPKIMTVVAIMAGLLPIMWSSRTGSEIMQRIAVPMIGGMISPTDPADADRHSRDLRARQGRGVEAELCAGGCGRGGGEHKIVIGNRPRPSFETRAKARSG